MTAKKDLLLLAVAAILIPPAAAELRGPVSGFVLDGRTKAIRAISGIPGAAVLGPGLDVGFPVLAAAFADRGRFAVVAGEGRLAVVAGLAEGAPQVAALQGFGGADLLALNEGGTAVAVYDRAASRIRVAGGLPERAEIRAEFEAPAAGEIRALALDNSGATLLVCVSGSGVYRFRADAGGAAPELVASSPDPVAIGLAGDRDAVFADRSNNSITKISDFRGQAFPVLLAGEGEGIKGPAGVAVAGPEVVVSNSGSSTVSFVRLTGGVSGSLELIGAPTRCTRLWGDFLYLLNEAGSAPLLLLETAPARSVYFVPAD